MVGQPQEEDHTERSFFDGHGESRVVGGLPIGVGKDEA